jgi:long-subunit fatty acid transport protein
MRRLACGVLLSLAILALVRPAGAGDAGLVNSETFGGFQFNFNNPGARALGMGGAFVAVADDATAVVANPAGLTILQRPEISAEYKFTRFRNNINAFSNTPDDGNTNTVRSRDFDNSVNTPSFFSFVYPTERLVVAAFVRELINYKSTFNTDGVYLNDPSGVGCVGLPPGLCRLLPVKSELEITALNFGLGAAVNLEKENPFLPNVGVSLEFSFGRIRSRLDRFGTFGPTGPPNTSDLQQTEEVDDTDIGIGVNVGLLWHPTKDLSFGGVYRRGPQYDMSFRVSTPGGFSASTPLGFKVPDVYAAGAAYRFFERLTLAFEATYIRYSQLVERFQVPLANTIATQYKLDDKVELHLGAEYIFFIKNIPLAARGGFYTNPDHKIRYSGPLDNVDAVGERLLYNGGKDRYQGTAGLGVVPFPGFQLDFASNYSKDILEFSVSSVFRF